MTFTKVTNTGIGSTGTVLLQNLDVIGIATVGFGVSTVDVFTTGITTFANATDSTSTTTGSVIVSGGVGIAGSLNVGGSVSVGGTLTYEDVTNVDSVGIITARSNILVGSGITLSPDGDVFTTGISTVKGIHVNGTQLGEDLKVGTGVTITRDGDGFFTGIVTATSFSGDGSNLTGISVDSTQIVTGNTSVQTVDTGSDGHVKVNTEGSERLRVGAGGSVGIGTDVPDTLLHLYGSSSTQKLLTFNGGNSKRNNYIGIAGADNLEIGVDEDDEGSGSTFRIRIDGAEKARITSGGLVLVGHDSVTGSGKIQASTAGQDGIDIIGYNSTAGNGGRLTFYRSKNATIGSNTEVADEDSLGRIDWRGYNDDGTAFNIGATIEAQVDGTIDSTTDMPSALLFKTSADGSSSPSERLRLTSGGRVLINSTAARNISTNINRMLQIESSGGGAGLAVARNSDNASGPSIDLGKSRGYPNTIVQSGDMLGQIRFAGADGTNLESPAAHIKVEVDGTPGENDMPGRIVFSTTADGAAAPTAHWQIDSTGRLDQLNSSAGIRFQYGHSVTPNDLEAVLSNTLDDFESGDLDWEIHKDNSLTTGTNASGSHAKYVKIGPVVHIFGWIRTDGQTSTNNRTAVMTDASGNRAQLPFTPSSPGAFMVSQSRSFNNTTTGTLMIAWDEGNDDVYVHMNQSNNYTPASDNCSLTTQTNLVIAFNGHYHTND